MKSNFQIFMDTVKELIPDTDLKWKIIDAGQKLGDSQFEKGIDEGARIWGKPKTIISTPNPHGDDEFAVPDELKVTA